MADTDDARAFLQHLAVTVGATPDNVAAALLRHPYLRGAVVIVINERWGAREGVHGLLEAEERLKAGSSPAPSSAVPSSAHAKTSEPAHASSAVAHGGEHRSAIERAIDLSRLGVAHLGAIETALLPAYRRAVAAMDTAAVKALAWQIVGGVARIVDAQAHVVRLVPQVDTGPHAAMASTAETDAFTPDATELATLTATKAALDAAVLATVPKLAVQVSPQWFGEELVAGRAPEPPPHVREVLVQLTYEAGLVVQLLDEADAIAKLIQPVNEARGTSEPSRHLSTPLG